jgi:hypothetical protein
MWENQGWGDSRVQVNSYVEFKWLEEIKKDPWLLASEDLFDLLKYQMWEDSIIVTSIDEGFNRNQDLRILKNQNFLTITARDEQLLHGLTIWDFQGRKLWNDLYARKEYLVSISDRFSGSGIIIRIMKNKEFITRKLVLD